MSSGLLNWYKEELARKGTNVSKYSDQQLTYSLGRKIEAKYGAQKVKEYPDFSKEYTSAVNAYKAEDLGRDGIFGGLKEIGAGFGQGLDETQGMLYGGAGYLAKKVGLDSASEYLMGKSLDNMRESQVDAPTIQSFSEVNSFGEGVRFLAGGLGRVIPSGATMVGTGGVGGLVGKQVLKKAVVGPALKKEARRLTKKGIDADDYTKSIGKRYADLPDEMKEVASGYAKGLSLVGTTTAASGTMGIGEVYSSLYPYTQLDPQDKEYVTPESAEALSWKFGLAIGALDSILPSMVGGPLLKKFFPSKTPTPSEIADADAFVKRNLLGAVAKGVGVESGTEAAQEYLNIVAEKYAHDKKSPFDLSRFTDEEINQMVDGGILGAIGGATFAGVTETVAGAQARYQDKYAQKERKEELRKSLEEIVRQEEGKIQQTEEAVGQIAPQKTFESGQQVITGDGQVGQFKEISGEDAIISYKDGDKLIQRKVPRKSLSAYEETTEESKETTEEAEENPVDTFRQEKAEEVTESKPEEKSKSSTKNVESEFKERLRSTEIEGVKITDLSAYELLSDFLENPELRRSEISSGKLTSLNSEKINSAYNKWADQFYMQGSYPSKNEFVSAFIRGAESELGKDFTTLGDEVFSDNKADKEQEERKKIEAKEAAENVRKKIKEKKAAEKEKDRRLARGVIIASGKKELFKFKDSDGINTLTFRETAKKIAQSKKDKTEYKIEPLSEQEWAEEIKQENLINVEKNPRSFKPRKTGYKDYLDDLEIFNQALNTNTASQAQIDYWLTEGEKEKVTPESPPKAPLKPEVKDGSTLESLPDVVSGTYTIGTDGKSKRVKVEEGDASTLADIIFNVDVAYKATSITTPDNIKINARFDGIAVVFKLAEPTFVPVSFKSKDNAQYIFGGEPTLLTNPKEQKHVRVKELQSVSGKPNPESLFLGTDKSKTYKPRLDLPSSAKSNPNRTAHIVAVRHKPTDKVMVRTLLKKDKKAHLAKIKNTRGQITLKDKAYAMSVEDVIDQENLEIVGAAWLSAHNGTLRQDFDSLVEYENWIDSFDKQPISTEGSSKVTGDIQSEIDKAEDSEYRGRIVELWNKESRTPQEEAELDLATLYFAHKDDIFVQARSGDGVQGRAFLEGKAPISEYHLGDLFYRRGELLSSTFDGQAALQGSSQKLQKKPDWRFWPDVQYIEDEIKRRGIDPKDANARKEAQEDFLSLGRNYIRIDTSASMQEKAVENAPTSSEPLLYFTDKDGNLLDNPKPEDLVMDLSLGLFSEKFKTEFAGRIKVTEAFSLLDSSQINLILEAIRSDQTYKGRASEASREKLYEEYKNRGVKKGGEDPKSGEQFKGNAQSFANEIIKAFLQLAPKVNQATGSLIIDNLSPDNTSSPSKVKDTLWNPENSLWDSANPFKIKQFAEWLSNDQVNTIIKYSRDNLQGIGDDTVARDTINLDQFSELSKNPKRIKKPEKLIYQIIQEYGEVTPVLAFVQWMGTQQELDITSNSIESKKGELSVQEQAEWKELSELYGNEGYEIKDQGFNILLEAEGGAQQKTGKGNITGAMGTRATMYALKLAREVDSSKAYVLTEKMMDAISEALVGDDSLSIGLLSAIVDARSNRQNTVRENIDTIEGDRQTFFKAAELIEAISLDALNQVTGKKLRNPYQLFNRAIVNIDKPNVYSTINKAQGEEIEAQGDLEVGVSAPGNYPIQSMADPYLGDSTNYSIAEFSDPYNLTQSSKRRTNFEQNIILPEGQSAKNERAIQNIIGENIFAPVVLERLKRYSENYGISEEAKDFISRYLEVLDQALSNADTPTNIVVVDEISSAPNSIVRGNRVGDTVFISKKFHAGKYDLVAEELPFNFVEDKTTNILMSVLLHEVWHNTMEAPLRLHEQRVNAGQKSEVQETVDLIKDVIKEVKKNPGSKKFTFLYSNENIAVSEILNYAWTRKDFAQFLANTKMTNEGIKKRIDQNGKNIISTLMDALYAAYIKLLKTFGVNPEGTALESILELSMQLEAQNQALIRDDRIVPSNVADRKTLNFLMTDIMDNSEMSMQLLQENKSQVVEEFDSSFEREDDFDYISTVINGDFDGLSPDELNYVKQSLKDLTPRMRNFLRALEREDYFGFDYPFQAIDALLTEDYEYLNGIDVSSSFKASLTKFVDDLLMNRQTMPKKPIPSVLTPIGNQEAETLKLDSDGFLKGHKFHVTKTENLESIRRGGIQAQEKSNWAKAGTGERYGKGMVFVMDNYFDAIRWATEMEWANNQTMGEGSISIVVIEDDTGPIKFSWAEDNADVISTSSNVGKWYMRAKGVPSKQISSSIKVGINEIKSLQTKNTESVELTKFPPKPEIVRKVTPKELTRLVAMEIVWDNNDRQLDRQLAGKLSESTSATYQEVLNEIDQLNSIFRATPIKRRVKFQNLAMDEGIKKYFGKGQNMQDALIEGEENANENQTLNRDANEIAGGKMEAAGHNELLASISEAMDEIRKILKEPTLSVEDVLKKFFPNSVSPLKKIKDLGKEFGGSMQEVTIESLKKNVGMSQHARTIALKLVESRLAKSRQLLSSNLDQLDEKQSKSLKSQVVSLEKQLIVDPSVIFDRSKQGDALSKQVNYERENAKQEMADTTVLEIDTGNASLFQSFSEITGSAQLTKDFVEFLNKKRAGRYSSDFLADIIYKVSGVDDIKSLTPQDIYNIIQTDQKVSNNEYILIASA